MVRPLSATSETTGARPTSTRTGSARAWRARGFAAALVAASLTGCGQPPPSAPCPDAAACVARAEEVGGRDRRAAVELLEVACDVHGDARACEEAGGWWLSGKVPVHGDPTGRGSPFGRGVKLLEAACRGGRGEACATLAGRHLRGLGLPRDKAAAASWFARGCDGGHAESCVDHGLLVEAGKDVAQDEALAMAQFRRACALGNGRGCTKAGLNLRATGDAVAGMALIDQGCALGFAAGCGLAAIAYEGGQDVPADPARRLERLAAGASLGDPRAIELLFAAEGGGAALLAQDAALAARCRGGDGGACLARARLAEIDGERDAARISGLLLDACRAGATDACGRLAERAEADLAAPPDGGVVLGHERACLGGRAASCRWLGDALTEGFLTEGVDLDRARLAYGDACRLGDVEACGMGPTTP